VHSNSGTGWRQHSGSGWGAASGDTSWADRESQARSTGDRRSGGFHGFGDGGGGGDRFGGGYGGGRFGGGGFGGCFAGRRWSPAYSGTSKRWPRIENTADLGRICSSFSSGASWLPSWNTWPLTTTMRALACGE
jgi:hypothetical protein